jgi:hypothetical protein
MYEDFISDVVVIEGIVNFVIQQILLSKEA